MTTQHAFLYLSFSQSASHLIPRPVGSLLISDTRAGPLVGITAPHRLTTEPSPENFTP